MANISNVGMGSMLVGSSGIGASWNKNNNYGVEENDLLDWLGYGSARREREYQTYMSNTAYQRAVQDMKKAGLNPGLMYGSGDKASTPSGASAKSGQGVGVISSIASILIGGAKMMAGTSSTALDAQIAKGTLNLANKLRDKNSAKKYNDLYDNLDKIKI